jgi:hypothetical protein
MSAPKNPVGGSTRQTSTLAAVRSSLCELTQGEIRWVMAYRMMDQEAKGDHLRFPESTARAHLLRSMSSVVAQT